MEKMKNRELMLGGKLNQVQNKVSWLVYKTKFNDNTEKIEPLRNKMFKLLSMK